MLGLSKSNSTDGLEKMLADWMADVGDRIGAERVTEAVSGALAGVSRTRKAVDKNVGALLAMANIPTMSEYRSMQARLSALQGSIRNLSRRLDDLNRQIEDSKKPARKRRAATKSAGASKSRKRSGTKSSRAKKPARPAKSARKRARS